MGKSYRIIDLEKELRSQDKETDTFQRESVCKTLEFKMRLVILKRLH